MTKAIEAFLLDVDGTLIDSNDAHARAWVDAFEAKELMIPFEDVRPLIGMGGDNLVKKLLGLGKDDPLAQALRENRSAIFRDQYLPGIKAFPQAAELLHALKSAGYRLVIATSSNEKDLRDLLAQTGLDGIVGEEVTAGDAERTKPCPDIVQAALKALKLSPKKTLMLGDTPYDVEAAARAGVKTIAFTCGGWSEEELKKAGAIEIYSDPAELLEKIQAEGAKPRAA